MRERKEEDFIPGTMNREIAPNIVFRPVRSWHSCTYAGERFTVIPGTNDSSGCMFKDVRGLRSCNIPYTVTHRVYWNIRYPRNFVSVFLSYPDAMGCCPHYFWEAHAGGDDTPRFDTEESMEKYVIKVLAKMNKRGNQK